MDVAIVAPCAVPIVRGGAENLWRGLEDHLNTRTTHRAEVIKLPLRELGLWELVDSYRRFSELDLSGFDVVLSGKYPAWMVEHPRHMVYMLHRLRGLYDSYHYFGLPTGIDPAGHPMVADVLAFMTANTGRRDALPELFERLAVLRAREACLPAALLAFPGPLVRRVVHHLDCVGMHPCAVARYGAISRTVQERDGGAYFPTGADVVVVHPPSGTAPPRRVSREPRFGRPYLFTVSRLDPPKRIDMLIAAMAVVPAGDLRLLIAGGGPDEERLRGLAGTDPRVGFCGRVGQDELHALYEGCRGVVFSPYDEDFGLVALEAMTFGRPVITTRDAGGPVELVEAGVTGWVVDPTPEALAEAMVELWADRPTRTRMGAEARRRGVGVSWDPLVAELEALT